MWKKIFKSFILIILILILIIGVLVSAGYYKYRYPLSNIIKSAYEKVEDVKKEDFNKRYPTKLYDKDGNLLREFKTMDYKYVDTKEINPFIKEAFVSIEDERFYKHKGVDYIGTIRAILTTVTSKGETTQGGSTITQQLVKNMILSSEVTIDRKLKEMVIAQELENKFSKDEILEFYLNNIYFGYNNYGIESSSNYFFSKKNTELTLAESALLAGITNNPTIFDPINNFDKANERKEIILDKMLELEVITEEQYNEAINQKIELKISDVTYDNSLVKYEESYAIDNVVEILMNKDGFNFKYIFKSEEDRLDYFKRYNEKYNEIKDSIIDGGYEIYTSIDLEKQAKLQEVVDNEFYGFTQTQDNGLYKRQASATVIDNKTGQVVAIVGGRSQEGNTFNRAFLGARQPGSTLKPLISYTPAFEKGLYPDYTMADEKIENGPVNWYAGYKGEVTLRYATEISLNTIPYRLTDKLGMTLVLNKLKNMEFKYLTENDKTPIMAIGGLTLGTTTVEMASGYSTLARNGEYIKPSSIQKIVSSSDGEVVYENDYYKKRVYDDGASYLMTDTLKGVLFKTHGTGYSAQMSNWKNQAGKTGSTDSDKDLWTIGYTPYYTTAVWVGDDIAEPIYSGYAAPKNIWRNIMNYLHQGLQDIEFEKPESIYTENNVLKAKSTVNLLLSEDRVQMEKNRIETENKMQTDRLNIKDYEIQYSISETEELNREYTAKKYLDELKAFNYDSLDKESSLKNLMNKTQSAISDIKRTEIYNEYLSEFDKVSLELNNKHYELTKKKEEEDKKVNEVETETEVETDTEINEEVPIEEDTVEVEETETETNTNTNESNGVETPVEIN